MSGVKSTVNEHTMKTPSSRRILIVDDEPDLVRLMTKVLAKAGFEPKGVSESALALQLFEHDGDFVAVISDFMMPGLNGFDLTRRIREIKPHIPIILVTGTAHQMTDNEAKSHGVQHVLRKPFLPSDLRELVISVLA